MRNLFSRGAVMAVFLAAAGTASAQTYVGSFNVQDGPLWTTNPPVYSALEAAALLFGGSPTDYAVSVDPNTTNPATITHTAHYDGWGENCAIYPETERVDDAPAGYNDPGGSGTARSAYVTDHQCSGQINYVWRLAAQPAATVAVPTMGEWGLALLASLAALAGLLQLRRRR